MIAQRGRRRSTSLVALLACCLLAAACGGEDVSSTTTTEGAGATASSAGAGPDETTTTTTEVRVPLGNGEKVTLAFAGDASFEGLVGSLQSDPEGLLASIAPTLGAADVTVVNLEAALGMAGGSPEAKTFAFRVPAE